MRTLLVRWAVIVIAVFLVAWGLPQIGLTGDPIIRYDDWLTLAIFAAVLALLNTFIRPIVGMLALPINCLTFGLFSIVINAAMFALAAALVPGVHVADFWAALVGAVAVSVVGALANMITGAR
ncbi:MAG TPA: phage holin family protein [Chloroflexia bacterium]|nr:phage holin family protein [Chloroflexia bacterium]